MSKAMLKISEDMTLPTDTVTSTVVVYGGKGMGKTNLGNVIVEELDACGLRWCVLDPMGVWWGLRHSKDGTGPGISCVILGGAHGDIPIEPTGGAIVADLVIDEHTNTVIDFSRKANGQMWSIGEKIRFVNDYARRLFERQGGLVDGRRREPIMQILDEAARYIPQIIPSGSIDLAKCVAAWEQICEEGRNIGLGVTFLTQRSARMNKSVSELADVMFAFRTIGPNSLSAVMDWLGEHVEKGHVRELASKVRELDIGQALVVSPGWLKVEKIARIRHRNTFDSSATPKAGERIRRVTGKAAKPDLAKYQARMSETIEKAKAEDPKLLKSRIFELEKQLKNGSTTLGGGKTNTSVSVFDTPMGVSQWMNYGAKYGYDKFFYDKFSKDWRAYMKRFHIFAAKLSAGIHKLNSDIEEFVPPQEPTSPQAPDGVSPARDMQPRHKAAAANAPTALPSGAPQEGITDAEQKIINAIGWMNAAGVAEPVNELVAFLAGYAHARSTGYTIPRGNLRARGLIAFPKPGHLCLTEDAKAHVSYPEVTTTEALHEAVLGVLDEAKKRVLKPLLNSYPNPMTNTELCAAAGYAHERSTGYTIPRGRLRTFGLIEFPRPGEVRASDILFI
jgi:hypothetical protein